MVTKAEVARAAGVSRTCVSVVLNNRPGVRIAAATRQHVLEVARRLGYEETSCDRHPSQASSAIAYVLGTGVHPPSGHKRDVSVLDQIHESAMEDDRSVTYMHAPDTPSVIRKVLRAIDRTRPLGVLLDGVVSESLVHALQKRQLPFAVMGVTPFACEPEWAGKVNTVSIDVRDGMFHLVRWLAGHGARSIAFACQSLHLLVNQLILQAYQDAVRELDLKYDPSLVQVCSTDADGQYLQSRFRELGIEYDSLLFGASSLAHTALSPIPHRRSSMSTRSTLIASYGSDITGELALHGVASAHVQCAEYARHAYDLLCAQIKNPERKPRQLRLRCTLYDPTKGSGR